MEITPEIQAVLDAQKEELTATFEESVKGLKESQQAVLSEKKAAKLEAERLALEAQQLTIEKATKDKDVETLTRSYEEKLELLKQQNDSLNTGIKQGKISELASGFVNASVVDDPFSRQAMQDVYSKRLDIREGKTVVLDAGGNLTALSIEDLNSEIMASSIYANHIKSGNSSGGGAGGNRMNGGAVNIKANINGSTTEKATALSAKIPAFSNLPLN